MSETKNLKLFKHDEPLESNENEFDIDKALNQNWDKVDEYVEQLNTDINSLQEENTKSKEEITNIKEEQETQNANIEENENKIVELQKENGELKEENSRLKEDLNAFPIVKASGEYVTLDTADSRFKELKICGNSKQETEPSTEAPSEIENVGSNINIFNKNENSGKTNGISTTMLDTGVRLTATTAGNWRYMGIELGRSELLGKTVTISSKIFASADNKPQIALFFGNKSSMSISIQAGSGLQHTGVLTHTIPADFPENCDRTYILLYANADGTCNVGDYVDYTDLKVEIGEKATPYSEYGCGSIGINICNRNLICDVLKGYNIDGNGIVSTYQGFDLNIIRVVKGQEYIISNDTSISNETTIVVGYFDEKPAFKSITYDGKRIMLGKDVCKFTAIRDGYVAIRSYSTDTNVQVELGTTSTAYKSHEQQDIVFPLSKGQKLYKGSYLAEDGIHHKRKQIALDGTEDWFTGVNLTNTIAFGLTLNDKTDGVGFCNSLKMRTSGISSVDEEFCQVENAGKIVYIKINKERLSSVDVTGFKAYLKSLYDAEKPIVIEYELAEEEVEAYTEEQAEAHKQIQNARSYEGQTNIFGLGGTSPIFEVTARRNLNTLFAGGDT